MDDISTFEHHPLLEELSEILCAHTERDAPEFFRILSVYYLGLMASCMRAKIDSPAFKEIPINNYVIALAPSGFGKGKSTGLIENSIMGDFRNTFRDFVLPDEAEKTISALASRFAAIRGTAESAEQDKLTKEYVNCGEYPFVFDGGSEPAIKQVRQLLLMANCGSLNLQIDEIGTNLEKIGTVEAMGTYLELYDIGMIKNKLTKNGADNKRGKELEGSTPANMLLFGTPIKLLDSGPNEKKFISLLQTGYARRCLFAWADDASIGDSVLHDEDADFDAVLEEIYQRMTNPANAAAAFKWRQHFASLADPMKLNWTMTTSKPVDKLVISYKLFCEQRVKEMSEFDSIRRAEMEHRYFRVLKVAGTLAFVEEELTITEDHVKAAIRLVEDSGESFKNLLAREPVEAKLARYIAYADHPLTHSELLQSLPFFKSLTTQEQKEKLTMAASWGYTQHIVIKKHFNDGIELYSGETLRETDLEAVYLSYSGDFSHNYDHGALPFDQLPQLLTAQDHHWSNHAFVDGHRCEDKTIPGFDLLVFDVDGTASLDMVHSLLEDYVFTTHTTKRHTDDVNRFRLIMPMNYELKLDAEDFREFIRNVMAWLPFPVDTSTIDRCRKWASNDLGSYHQNLEGQLFDVLPFVPKTKMNERRNKEDKKLASYDNLERWFAQRIAEGNRNNSMIKFALALVDSGMDYNDVERRVLSFNSKLSNAMTPEELQHTVLVTSAKRIQDRAA